MVNARNPTKTRSAAGRSRKLVTVPGSLVTMSFESNITKAIEAFESDFREHVIRSATYAGAKVLYSAMRQLVPVKSGDLYGAIYHWFDKNNSTAYKKIYLIGPNKREAPHWYNVEYGHWRYNRSVKHRWQRSKSQPNARVATPGTMDRRVHDLPGALDVPVWVPAQPYIRNTWTAFSGKALQASKDRARERIGDLMRRGVGATKVESG